MTTVEERLARLEVQVEGVRHDVAKLVAWWEESIQREAVRLRLEHWGSRVIWIALGAIVPIALAILAGWMRLGMQAASGP